MALFEQRIEQSVQEQHLSGRIDQVVIDDQLVGLLVCWPIEQEGMGRDLDCQLSLSIRAALCN